MRGRIISSALIIQGLCIIFIAGGFAWRVRGLWVRLEGLLT